MPDFPTTLRAAEGLAFGGAVSAAGFFLRWLDLGGAVAALLVGTIVFAAGGFEWSLPLLAFFATSSLLSKLFGTKKERKPRTAFQVLANGGPMAMAALLFAWRGNPGLAAAFAASLAAANGDTWATEIGTRFGKGYCHILSLQAAPKGISGAVSVVGLVAAFAGSALIALSAIPMGMAAYVPMIATVGFVGTLLDSVLGDSLEAPEEGHPRRGLSWMTNDAVNFAMTLSAAIAAYFLAAARQSL